MSTMVAVCASCRAADVVARLVRDHYGLGPPRALDRCDHDLPAGPAELEGLVDRMRADFPPPAAPGGAASPQEVGSDPASRPRAPAHPAAPVPGHPLDQQVLRWAAFLGVAPDRFRTDRRSFIEGRLGVPSPVRVGDVLRAVLPFLHRHHVLQPDRHRVTLVRGGLVGSHTVPVRLPGESLVVVPGDAGPLCAQYVMHEMGHVVEQAHRDRGPLPARFAFDAARSEGIGVLFERLARQPDWWALVGLDHLVDGRVVQHLGYENDWSMAIAAVITRTDGAEVGPSWSLSAAELAGHRRQSAYWRALQRGAAWARDVDQRLTVGWGERWWRAAGPWEWMLTTRFDEEAL